MIHDYFTRVLIYLETWEWGPGAIVLGIPILLILGLSIAILRYIQSSRPRQLEGIFTAGLDGGKRSLQQAREHFTFNCAEMMLEGYEKVSSETILHLTRTVLMFNQTNGGFFYVPSPAGERLMIPTRYIEELKNAPDREADFTGSFLEVKCRRHLCGEVSLLTL